MKKVFAIVIGILLLVSCSPQNDVGRYIDEESNISFEYPSSWAIIESEKSEHAVDLFPNYNEHFFFDYQSEGFAEYENDLKDLIDNKRILVKEVMFGNFPAKEYGMEGAINYLIELDGVFAFISTEFGLDQQKKEGFEAILNSLSLN